MIGLVPVGQPLNSAYFSDDSLSVALFKFTLSYGFHDIFIFEVESSELTRSALCSAIPLKIIKKSNLKNIFNGNLEQLQFNI